MSKNFQTGAAAAKEAAAKQNSGFNRTEFFHLEADEEAFVRFLADGDEWIVVDMHSNVPTKARPKDYPKDSKWPEYMSAVCRYSEMGEPGSGDTYADDCFICDHIPERIKNKKTDEFEERKFRKSSRPWTLVCMREEILAPEDIFEEDEDGNPLLDKDDNPIIAIRKGQRIGFKDARKEVTVKEGEGEKAKETKKIVRDIRVINLGWKNFFSPLEGMFHAHGTLLDRDYLIRRKGEKLDTDYDIIGMDPIDYESPEHGDIRRYDIREPEVRALYSNMPVLSEEVDAKANNEYYARFFDTRVSSEDVEGEGEESSTPKPDTDVAPAALSALAARVLERHPDEDGAASEVPAPDAAPAPAKKAAATKKASTRKVAALALDAD